MPAPSVLHDLYINLLVVRSEDRASGTAFTYNAVGAAERALSDALIDAMKGLAPLFEKSPKRPWRVVESEPGIDDEVEYAVIGADDEVVALGCYLRHAELIALLGNTFGGGDVSK